MKIMKLCIVVLFLAFSFVANSQDVNCSSPQTTLEISACSKKDAEIAQADLEQYLSKAMGKYSEEINAVEALRKSQEAWLVYLETYCDAIYELWSGGTIRDAKYNGCLLQLTKQRMHTIWEHYLTYLDSTEPDLPEPQ